MSPTTTTLQWPDYVILVSFLVISLGIGVYHSLTGGRQRTTAEFIMANRRLSVIPTAISILVSHLSAILILGLTAEMYLYGAHLLVWASVGFTIALVIVERLVVPWIYPLKLVSVNEYLEKRYNSKLVRAFGSLSSIICSVMYMGIAMYAPSVALETATGFPIVATIPLLGIISISYTALGGMRAVIWTDVFQFVIMTGGVLAVMIKGIIDVGGPAAVIRLCSENGRMVTTNWSPDPTVRHTVWGFLFGWSCTWVQLFGLSQASVQRYSATESLTKSRITILLNILPLVLLETITCVTGLTVFAYFSSVRCDPLINGDVSNPNQILPLFVTIIFASVPGVLGLFLATLYGGSLSTLSSSLSGVAANCWDDILKLWLSDTKEHVKALINRFLVIVFGTASVGLAFLSATIPGPISQLTFSLISCVFGPITGLFIMGGVSRVANWKGAVAGYVVSFFINIWISVGAQTLTVRHATLPPVAVDGCVTETNTSPLMYVDFNETMTAFSVTPDVLYNHTVTDSWQQPQSVSDLRGLSRLYSISYIYYSLISMINCIIVGLIVSLLTRDRRREAEIPDCLLIPFRQCLGGWSRRKRNVETPSACEDISTKTSKRPDVKLLDGSPKFITNTTQSTDNMKTTPA